MAMKSFVTAMLVICMWKVIRMTEKMNKIDREFEKWSVKTWGKPFDYPYMNNGEETYNFSRDVYSSGYIQGVKDENKRISAGMKKIEQKHYAL